MASEWVEDPVFNVRHRFSPKGDALEVESEAQPGGGVLLEHFHPATTERFEVKDGEFTFTADGEKRVAGPGDEVLVEPKVRHTFVNTGREPGRVVCLADPPLGLQGFLEETAALAQADKYTRRGLPKSVAAALEAAEIAERYRDTVVMTFRAFPPPALQGLLLPPIARFQRRRQRR
jgi:mannose-6-phosphate isomerase-like protein (cupin superfamily)